jgi:hypothetical protein
MKEYDSQEVGSVRSIAVSTLIGYSGCSGLEALIASGHVDTLLTSTETVLSPFPHDLISTELRIPKRELYRWAEQVSTSRAVTLIALASRRSDSRLMGTILMPYGTSECYKALVAPEHRGLPYHDFYYNITSEGISWSAMNWSSRRIATTHLSGCGQSFHPDIPLTQCEAILHGQRLPEPIALERFCFLGCGCFTDGVFDGFEDKLKMLNGEHHPIALSASEPEHGVFVLILDWRTPSQKATDVKS